MQQLEVGAAKGADPGLGQEIFWKVLKHLVVKAAISEAREMLSLHWLVGKGYEDADLGPEDRCLQVLFPVS
jgi:hypothetical protein